MKKTYTVVSQITNGAKVLEKGDSIELDEEVAKGLISEGVIEDGTTSEKEAAEKEAAEKSKTKLKEKKGK